MARPEIVFFGSGPVAAKSLELLTKNFEVLAVVTKPKPPHHKGDFPVISLAEKLNLPYFTVSNKKELSDFIATKPFQTELAVLIDFGIIVSQDVIEYFPKGIVNSHFSLLPEWRGADPITFAILSGQEKTGVSLMLIDEGMDTGNLIRQKSLKIKPDATTPTLTDELIRLSDELLIEDLPAYMTGTLPPRNQPHPDRATYSRKLTKEDGVLDFTKPAAVLEREIRAFIEWPKSRTSLAGIDVIITQAHAVPSKIGEPGEIEALKDKGILNISTSDGYLCVDKLKPAGKKEMTAKEFLAGYSSRLT